MRPKALQFGAGNIGRGFLGQLFFESGYETVFADVNTDLIEEINRRRSYPIRIVGDSSYDVIVRGVRAVNVEDSDVVVKEIASVDVAATAVGVKALPTVAQVIARGLESRFQRADVSPLNIIVCENMIDAGAFLKGQIADELSLAYRDKLESRVGFVDASIGRMVPLMTEEQRTADPLLILVEEYCELPVDKAAFKGPIPPIRNLKPYENFRAYVERKLYIHNTGHAITAYLGRLRGHTFIWEAINDPAIPERVRAALDESKEALIRTHGLSGSDLGAHIEDLLRRFGNVALGDTVFRVARDPIRKLAKHDRLMGAASAALKAGVTPINIAFGVAAALHYDEPADPEAITLKRLREERGVEAVLREICEVSPANELFEIVTRGLDNLRAAGWVS